MQPCSHLVRNNGFVRVVVILTTSGLEESKAGEDPMDMGINSKAVPSEGVDHDASGGLRTDSRQAQQELFYDAVWQGTEVL
jgi:hypothetical protein